jgi:hypothetical protein
MSSINFKTNKNDSSFSQKSDLQQRSGYFESNSYSNLARQRSNLTIKSNGSQKLVASRAHQILLANKMSLNNLINNCVNDPNSRLTNERTFITLTNDSNFSNYAPSCSGMNSGRTSSQINLNNQSNFFKHNKISLKMPFKQYLSRNNTQLTMTVKNSEIQNKEKALFSNQKPNPSNELILKTVQVVNNYVDQFEKAKLGSTNNQHQSHLLLARKIRATTSGFNK